MGHTSLRHDAFLYELAAAMAPDDADPDDDPKALAQAVDEALDACMEEWVAGEIDSAKALLTSAMTAIDKLLEIMGVADPDEDESAAAARKAKAKDRAANMPPWMLKKPKPT